jgi:lipopolysaccharide transport system permease protein
MNHFTPAGWIPQVSKPLKTTRIGPETGWRLFNASELWRYRELLLILSWRDVKVRYKQALLGVAWAVVQPAMMMMLFSVFLSRMGGFSSGDVPYPLFALAGLVAWTFVSTALGQSSASVVASEKLITKIYFPRIVVPLAAVGAVLFDFAISLGLLGLVMAANNHAPSWQIVFAPLAFTILLLTATGAGLILSALTVSFRDFRYVTPFLIQAGLFATPTIYTIPPADLSEAMKLWLVINPLAAPIEGFRASLLGGPMPWSGLAMSSCVAIVLFISGCAYFNMTEEEFSDKI